METLIWLLEHADILLGFILLLVACLILPGNVRWYVLTAGVALLAMQMWQAYRAREKLKALDQQREQLQDQLAALEDVAAELKQQNGELEKEALALEQERQGLLQRLQELESGDAGLRAEQQSLQQQADQQLQQIADIRERNRQALDALAQVRALQTAAQE